MQVWIKCPSSIGLEYGRHTDSCMNMQASVQRCKDAKKIKRVAQSKQGKYIYITRSGERCESSTPTPRRCISQVVTPKQARGGMYATTQSKWPWGLISTSPRRAQSIAKPRSREANIEIKHRRKQANRDIHKGNDPNPLIQAQVCGCKPRPRDLDLHPTNKGQNTRNRDIKEQKGYRSTHGIETNIDISTPTWHGAHKHINLSIGMQI